MTDDKNFGTLNTLEAYEILSDEKKRELYDQYGLEGVEQEGGPIRITQIKSQIPLFELNLDHSKYQLLRCCIMIGWWNAKHVLVT